MSSKNFKQYRMPYDHSSEAQSRRGILSGVARNARNEVTNHNIWELFSEGRTIPFIAKELDLSVSRVRHAVNKVFRRKLPPLSMAERSERSRRANNRRSRALAAGVVADRLAGMLIREIAVKRDCTERNCQYILARRGIKVVLRRYPRKVQRFTR